MIVPLRPEWKTWEEDCMEQGVRVCVEVSRELVGYH